MNQNMNVMVKTIAIAVLDSTWIGGLLCFTFGSVGKLGNIGGGRAVMNEEALFLLGVFSWLLLLLLNLPRL